ncbi:acyl-coenzyme A thioesterase 13-like [Diadema antillarum]|uniref:acyl-coenzyme A thioesterase 13-like n=1 Tax=Diadema antillarum TaxID=105358 RepID=UPI003A87CA24
MAAGNGTLQVAKSVVDLLVRNSPRFNSIFSTFSVTHATKNKLTMDYEVLTSHTNDGNTLHGGFTASAFDFATTVALLLDQDDPRPGVSLNLSINYLKALKAGEKVTFEAEVLRRGRTIAYTVASLFNEKGELAAHGTHIKHLGSR